MNFEIKGTLKNTFKVLIQNFIKQLLSLEHH